MPRGRRALARQRGEKPVAAVKLTIEAPGVSVNHATIEALTAVAGIGAAVAEQIVAGRPWRDLGALTRIRGVSAGRVARWQGEAGLSL